MSIAGLQYTVQKRNMYICTHECIDIQISIDWLASVVGSIWL